MERESLMLSICDYINTHIKEEIRIEDLANTFHFDRYHLMRTFKKEMGLTIIDYINKKRVQNSMPPLVYTDDKILKIALNNGFNSLEYYSEQFTKIVGMSPVNFRKLSTIYDMTPYFDKGDNMESKKLETIRQNINDLVKLREELLGTNTKTEVSEKNQKVYSLISKPNKNIAA